MTRRFLSSLICFILEAKTRDWVSSSPYVETAGGHAGAAGITVSQAHYPQMVRAMVQYMEDNPLPEQEDVLYYDLDLSEDYSF